MQVRTNQLEEDYRKRFLKWQGNYKIHGFWQGTSMKCSTPGKEVTGLRPGGEGEETSRLAWKIVEWKMLGSTFKGTKFTWKRGLCLERLDKGLVSKNWELLFKVNPILHLPRLLSDHSLLFVVAMHTTSKGSKSFRYQAAWTTHPNWTPFLSYCWREELELGVNLEATSTRAEVWNVQVGNVFSKKKRLLARLVGIQKAIETHATRNLRRLGKKSGRI